jgi:hypothetical protein
LQEVADTVQPASPPPQAPPRQPPSAGATPSAGFDGEVARLFGTVNPDTMARLAADPNLAMRQAEIMARTAIQNQTGQTVRQAPPEAVEAAMRVLQQFIGSGGR